MSEDPTYPTQTPMLFAEDSLANHLAKRGDSKLKTTPDISGRKCLGLSGNAGPLGLLEKTLLESSAWAWTKYSLTWRAKATPQGRLIFQLARLAPRTSDNDSGLLHTPTAKANQTSPSMAKKGKGNWVSGLADQVKASAPKTGGKLNPQWVAWLMGYPTEFLNSVPWATQSSRKSQKK